LWYHVEGRPEKSTSDAFLSEPTSHGEQKDYRIPVIGVGWRQPPYLSQPTTRAVPALGLASRHLCSQTDFGSQKGTPITECLLNTYGNSRLAAYSTTCAQGVPAHVALAAPSSHAISPPFPCCLQ